MVSIAIIAVLVAIGATVYASVQKQARAVKRAADLKEITTALEVYKAQNGSYPTTAGWRSECPSWGGHPSYNVIPGLVPTYMQNFPSDPKMNKATNTYCYLYISDGRDYKLRIHAITEFTAADFSRQPNLVDTATDGGLDCSILDGPERWAWSAYSSATSACW